MPVLRVLLGLVECVCVAWIPESTVMGWRGAGAHSSEAGLGHKGAGEEYLGLESELGERTPQPNLDTLQRL